MAPASHCLNRPRTVTRRIILQKARCQATVQARSSPTTARTQTGSGSVSLPSPGCFSPFPHGTVRYRSLGVACLGEWAPQLHTTLPVCGATQEHRPASVAFGLPGCHGLWRSVPNCFDSVTCSTWLPQHRSYLCLTTPTTQGVLAWHVVGLGMPHFARHYFGDGHTSSGY